MRITREGQQDTTYVAEDVDYSGGGYLLQAAIVMFGISALGRNPVGAINTTGTIPDPLETTEVSGALARFFPLTSIRGRGLAL